MDDQTPNLQTEDNEATSEQPNNSGQVVDKVPTSQAPTNANSSSDINLDGVESSLGAFLLKKWWLIILILILSAAVAYFANLIYGIIVFFISFAALKPMYEKSLFKAFANANNFSYQKKGGLTSQLGVIFSIGHSREFSDIVSGNYMAWTFLLFMYSYTIGSGRSSHTYDRAVMAINFNTALPAFVLKRHKLLQILDEEGESLKSGGYSEKINLEGDFNEHFQVYIRPDTQDDVLAILTPDVMQILVSLDQYEIEMTDNGTFYVYCHGYITKKQSLIEVYKIVESVADKIGRYANREQQLSNMVRST